MTDKRRREVLSRMEAIIGNSCYNGNIQNWGPGGRWHGEGREFRYPITFVDSQGETNKKRRSADPAMPLGQMKSGHYVLGANELHIMRALDQVLVFLEKEHGLDISDTAKKRCPHCKKKIGDIDQHISHAHPDEWPSYSKNKWVQDRLTNRVRCSNCGCFLNSMDGHDAKCPKTLNR